MVTKHLQSYVILVDSPGQFWLNDSELKSQSHSSSTPDFTRKDCFKRLQLRDQSSVWNS